MTEEIKQKIQRLITYLEEDEKQDFVQNPSSGHIYYTVLELKKWLKSLDNEKDIAEIEVK